ncbi:MAG: hypothetical protein JO039_01930, partial [Solirubrobacterales bacterium]|nr:hypothetical protein [Solirubrobacterales bacterium]
IEDAKLRDNVRSAFDASRSAYGRLSNGKAPTKALLEDKKLQRDLRNAAESLRDATVALTAPPKKQRRVRGLARMVFVLVLGAGVAMVASEKLRSKVLDTLFGAEEEFEYTPPPPPPPPPATGTSPPTTPVSAA